MENILSEQEEQNLLQILDIHTQTKHFITLSEELKVSGNKKQIFNKMMDMLKSEDILVEDFKSWLSLHQLHGNNYFFIFELFNNDFNESFFDDCMSKIKPKLENILNCNAETLLKSKLVNAYHDKRLKRVIFTYVSPAKVMIKVQTENAGLQDEIKKQIYFANIIIDYGYNIAIISINPTARLVSVDDVDKTRGFEPIANYYLKKIKEVIGAFYIRSPKYWFSNALNQLTEEATYHNNPKIEEVLTQANPIMIDMVDELMDKYSLNDQALNLYVTEEFQRAFENALIDKYGYAEDKQTGFRVFEQKGDQVNATVHIECKNSSSNLQSGQLAKVAKTTRNNSDLTLLGIEYVMDKGRYKFIVSLESDYFLIKSKTIKFTEEEVIRDVIEKLEFYRRKIQRESSDFSE